MKLNEGLKTILQQTFKDCTSLTSITLPASLDTIAPLVFSGCTSLAKVTSLSLTPPGLAEDAFDEATYTTAFLEVPDAAAKFYSNAPAWKNFINSTAGIDDLLDNNEVTVYGGIGEIIAPDGAQAYAIDGRPSRLTGLRSGLYLVVYRGKTYKVVVR